MADVEDAASAGEEAMASELVDLTKVRTKVREAVETGELAGAATLLEQISRWPDSTRYLEDNVWIYRKLGDLHQAIENDEEALEAYERAFELEPRELDVLKPYSELLFHHDRAEDGLEVVQSLLLHHKNGLPPHQRASIYRRMASFHETSGNYEKARTSFEKALEQNPGDQAALTGLLRVVAESAEPLDVIRVRQKLIRNLDDSQARSMALVALGNDWINEFNDPGRALDVYEQAITEHRENKTALERLATVGSEIGDWRRVSRAYFTLAQLTDEPKEKADWIIRSSMVARDELWEADKALTGFKKALELDPTRLDAFKAVTSILVDSKSWEELEQAYLDLISRNADIGNDDPKLMAVLWQKLGDLYKIHLEQEEDAIFAYHQAASKLPQNYNLHASVADLAEKNEDNFDKAIEHLRAMRRLQPDEFELLDRLGRVYLRKKDIDRAFCIFRALDHLGHPLDEKARGFVDRFDTAMFRPIDSKIPPSVLKEYIFSESLDTGVSSVFARLKPALEKWTGESRSKYGLKRRDAVDLDENLVFNTIYKSIGKSLDYRSLPDIWHKQEQDGLINGALVPEGLIVGDDLLGSGREEHIAFIIAKQLFLFLPPFYVVPLRPLSDLQVFFILAAAFVKPDVQIDMTDDMEKLFKRYKKNVKGKDYDALRKAVNKVSNRETDLATWVESVEDSANRCGFLFSDDLNASRDYLENEPQSIGGRGVDKKMRALVEWQVSEKYFELRERLGITIG